MESNIQYHADTSHVSNSMMKALNDSPRVFEGKYITKTIPQKKADHFTIGTAVHTAALEPEVFAEAYAVGPEGANDKRIKRWKDFAKQYEGMDVTPLTDKEAAQIAACVRALRSNAFVRLALDERGHVEQSFRWTCRYTDVPCKYRPDKVCQAAKLILDIKTIDTLTDAKFAWNASDFGYDTQEAHYREGAAMQFGDSDQWKMIFGVVEATPPFRCRAFCLDDDWLEFGYSKRKALLLDYQSRMQSGDWSEADENQLVALSNPRRR